MWGWARAGFFPFYINETVSEWSSFDKSVASRGHPIHEISVQLYDIRAVLKAFGVPAYLNIDIEDYDKFVIYALPGLDVFPKYVSVENGAPLMFESLVKAGYDNFMFVNQRDVPLARMPNPSSEGLSIDYVFKYGSSGPFGSDLSGVWLNATAMRVFLEKWWAGAPETDSWYDLHASLA